MPRSVVYKKYAVPPHENTSPSTKHFGFAMHQENELILAALRVIESRLASPGETLNSPDKVKQYLSIRLGEQPHESFLVLFLDIQNRLMDMMELFRGTLAQTCVYPREVVKEALLRNAAAVILAHNHPSGEPEPSAADHALTHALKTALAIVDVRVLDHIIVAGTRQYSFAEHGSL